MEVKLIGDLNNIFAAYAEFALLGFKISDFELNAEFRSCTFTIPEINDLDEIRAILKTNNLNLEFIRHIDPNRKRRPYKVTKSMINIINSVQDFQSQYNQISAFETSHFLVELKFYENCSFEDLCERTGLSDSLLERESEADMEKLSLDSFLKIAEYFYLGGEEKNQSFLTCFNIAFGKSFGKSY